MPDVNDPFHKRLQTDCEQWLTANGFSVHSNEPHLRPEFKALAAIDTPAAHAIRTTSDRIAWKNDIVIRWDAKTCGWSKGSQFAIEAIPFIKACTDGVPYVFVCRRRDNSEEFGIEGIPENLHLFDKILIPKWRRGNDPQWMILAEKWKSDLQLDCTIIPDADCSKGSGDMLVTINVIDLPHWKDLFLEV